MPSGRTHDAVSYALIPISLVAFQWYWGDLAISLIATVAMAFAGFMFGPDLDIQSAQYKRWGPVRFIWAPYKLAISHRSRLSHGLVFSTLFRLLYFLTVVVLLSTSVFYLRHRYLYGVGTTWSGEFQRVSDDLTAVWRETDKQYFKAAFIGLWSGAAVHTIIDLVTSIARLMWKAF